MTYLTNSPMETQSLGAKLGAKLLPGTVIAYRGDLGAGKTAFTRGIAQGLGATDLVTSPTYTIVNEYLSGRIPLFHFDMYRLPDSDSLFDGAASAPWSGPKMWPALWPMPCSSPLKKPEKTPGELR